MLQKIPNKDLNVACSNRLNYLQACKANPYKPTFEPAYVKPPNGSLHFDRMKDSTCLEARGGLGSVADTLSAIRVTYERPIPRPTQQKDGSMSAEMSMSGPGVLDLLQKWVSNGIRLMGGSDDKGFLFFYELMTGKLNFKILDTDDTFKLASNLMRMMPQSDAEQSSKLKTAKFCTAE